MTDDRTEARRTAYAAIITWPVQQYERACRDPDAPTSTSTAATAYFAMDSDSESMVLALRCIDVIAPTGAGREAYKGVSGAFQFTVPPDTCGDVARERFDDGRNFDAALRAFALRAIHHAAIPIDRAPFDIDPTMARVFDPLSDAGFLARSDQRYRWTDAMIPTMLAVRFWDQAGQSAASRLGRPDRSQAEPDGL